MVDMSRFFKRKKKEEKKEEKEEEKEENLLKQLCGDDEKLYDVLASLLYLNPITGISKRNLEILIEEAEKSIKENYEGAMLKNRLVLDKAIFEATQNPREKGRYIKVIQDLASKTVHVMEKAKEGVEKNGLTDQAASLERSIKNYKFIGERIEDVINVASQFYNEQLLTLGETERREARGEEKLREKKRE